MKITNKKSLPEPLLLAISADTYERGTADFTATELITPTRILSYRRKYDAVLEEDASDMIWRLQGSVKHLLFERIAKAAPNPDRYLIEQRFETVMPSTGARISGQIDLYDKDTKTLYDYKETSVWKFIIGDTEEWEQQANILVYILRQNNIYPEIIQNIALLKDWKARKARFTKEEYPTSAINVMPLPMWSVGQAQDYINKRVEKHRAEAADPPVCNKKERWQRDASFAVMRTDRKRAMRLYQNRDQAEAAMLQAMKIAPPGDAKKFYIETRNAEPVRCLDFCSVQLQCDFGLDAEAKWKEKHEGEAK